MARRSRKPSSSRRSKRPQATPQQVAEVIEMHGLEAWVRLDGSDPTAPLTRALLRRKLGRKSGIVVGDRVGLLPLDDHPDGVAHADAPSAVIHTVLPRKNALIRAGWRGHPQPIAANLDRVIIVVAARNPALRLGLIDRYLAACFQCNIPPAICLNKCDLDEDGSALESLQCYPPLGVPVVSTDLGDARDGTAPGVAALRDLIGTGRVVFVGHSGVGKSSLACALIPGLNRAIGDVNETIGKGRHTTTSSSLLGLPSGGELVDTPGIRAFGLYGVPHDKLHALYPEFEPYEESCRFRGCTHIHEPKCAVKEAIAQGDVDSGRYERYCALVQALQEEEAERNL